MTQDELDRLLEEALDVEPPAGYVARVRARVAAEQATSTGGRAWWPLGALASGVLVLVVGGLILERDDDSTVGVTMTTSRAPDNGVGGGNGFEAAPAPVVAPAGDTRRTAPARRQRGAITASPAGAGRSTSPADTLPTVVISPDDAAGLWLLTTFTEPDLAAPATGGGERQVPQISRIDLAPIEVDSLPELTLLVLGELQ